ncbi:extracellular solute-binding protein [Cohnella xylanilytica]|uniref:Extracellular solute-binding protein n=1 Tax=Cohnella xylanilytica TaxID=557555 RepID=A0A841TRE6_9BACL|nr:extracellular solute-binding protein [Cohnella xylanilytica]MBB6690866.1 extracellular solute-binding protein [Cohnella xylanilytica]
MRKAKLKWTAAASSALLLTAALSACQSGGDEPGDSPSGSAPAAASPSADSPSGAGGKQTLTVAVFTQDRFLKEAVDKFEAAHPDIDVQIQETVPTDLSDGKQIRMQKGPDDGPSAADKDKYVNSVGTALMSGNAADLISTSYLPVDKYLAKGMFSDWNGIAGQDAGFQASDYYERVLKGMSGDKGWYAIPIGYSLDVLIGNKPAVEKAGGVDDKTWDWETFIALCEKIAKNGGADGTSPALGGMKPEDLLGYLTETVYDKLVTREGNSSSFDEAAFRGYLEQIQRLYDSGAASGEDLGKANQVFSPVSMKGLSELAMLPSAIGRSEGEVLNPPGTGKDEGIPFESDLAFALNERSKVKPAAWEFVKFLLSEEIQSSPALMSFPVHQAAARAKLEDFAEKLQSGSMKMMIKNKDGGPAQSLSITEEQIESALALLPSVGKYQHKDDKVIAMVKEEAASFFSGGKSAEAVAKAVASRVNTYLNE